MFFGQKKSSDTAVTFESVWADIENGGVLLDVRTPGEFADGHIAGAVSLPVQNIAQGQLPSATKSQNIYVYCLSGGRSGQAASILKSAGYTDVINLGSIRSVQQMGGSIEQ